MTFGYFTLFHAISNNPCIFLRLSSFRNICYFFGCDAPRIIRLGYDTFDANFRRDSVQKNRINEINAIGYFVMVFRPAI